MPRPISRQLHVFADFSYIPSVAAAPQLFGFKREKNAVLLCRTFSALTTLSALFTRAEWGPIPLIPFKFHVTLDFLSGVMALPVPWLFGFARNKPARNTFLAMGIVGIVVGLLTEPENMD